MSGFPSVGDFNGDGKLDLIIGPQYAGTAAILLGNGDGTFRQPIFSFLESGLIAVVDLNQDGSPDVVAGTGYDTAASAIAVMLSTPFKAVAPASLNFGSQGVGTTSAAKSSPLATRAT